MLRLLSNRSTDSTLKLWDVDSQENTKVCLGVLWRKGLVAFDPFDLSDDRSILL